MEEIEAQLDAFLLDLQTRYRTALRKHALTVLPRFFSHLREARIRDLRSVQEAHLVSFARHLEAASSRRDGAPLSPWTRAAYLGAVKAFFAFLERRRVILMNPARHLPLPKARRLPDRALRRGEAQRLMTAPSGQGPLCLRDRAVLELLYGAGIRLSECVRLDLRDVDLQQETLFIRDGKGRKDRLLPFGGRAAAALREYLRDGRAGLASRPGEMALFLSQYGTRLGPASVENLVRKHGRAEGLRVFPHLLRHACATHLLQGGADVRYVQELLGHKNLETTGLYTRVVIKDLREALVRARLPRRSGPARKP